MSAALIFAGAVIVLLILGETGFRALGWLIGGAVSLLGGRDQTPG